MLAKLPRTIGNGKAQPPRHQENSGKSSDAQPVAVIPYVRPAWLLEDGDILDLETFALIYDTATESTRYLARRVGHVGTVREFDGANITFREGDALRINCLRLEQNGGADKRRQRLMEEQQRQCDDAIAELMR